jgi:hypothetical protein
MIAMNPKRYGFQKESCLDPWGARVIQCHRDGYKGSFCNGQSYLPRLAACEFPIIHPIPDNDRYTEIATLIVPPNGF